MAGYSGTPLAAKLGLKPGMRAAVINAPWDYAAVLGLEGAFLAVAGEEAIPEGADFIHLFTASRSALERRLREARATMAQAGMLWVSWPKKSSRRPSEITEDTIRQVCLPLGFVDTKVCAVDEVWSGLKLVVRKELRTE